MAIFKSNDTNNGIGNIIFILFEGFNKISMSNQYHQQVTNLIKNDKRFNFKADLFYEYSLYIIIGYIKNIATCFNQRLSSIVIDCTVIDKDH